MRPGSQHGTPAGTRSGFRSGLTALTLLIALALTPTARAEMLEEIVAWVNGEIITLSELERQRAAMLAEASRQVPPERLAELQATLDSQVLNQMIDNQILVTRAKDLFDTTRMADNLFQNFMEQEGFTDRDEFIAQIEQEGFTEDSFKDRLVALYAPDELLRFEIRSRLSVSDRAIDLYYDEHQGEFMLPAAVDVCEIVLLADTPAKRAERRDEAFALYSRAQTEDCSTLAREYSEAGTRDNGGRIDDMMREDMAEALREVAFNAPIGQIAEPVERPYGWHLIQVINRRDERPQDEEQTREAIRRQLMQERYEEDVKRFLEKARAEAEWCVKPKYRNRLQIPSPECDVL